MLDSPSSDELEFIKAIEKYKQENRKLFLSWTEVLKILKDLGYRRFAREAAHQNTAHDKTAHDKTARHKAECETPSKETQRVT